MPYFHGCAGVEINGSRGLVEARNPTWLGAPASRRQGRLLPAECRSFPKGWPRQLPIERKGKSSSQQPTARNARERFTHRFAGDRCVVVDLSSKPPSVAESEVSAVMARLPATISPILCGGTPMSLARRYFVRPRGLRNSSSSISPGETGGTVRMVECLQ